MNTNNIQGIVPAVAPIWPEFDPTYPTLILADSTYMVLQQLSYSVVSSLLSTRANITLIFAGGKITGSGTLVGNYTTIIAPPIQIFDSTITFGGTWRQEKVYAENFDTILSMSSNAAPAINKALQFSNVSGCRVILLGKTYNITQTIKILGNTTLEGTICGPSYTTDSDFSNIGTRIQTTGNALMIKIETDGNKLALYATVDCYRFVLRNLALYTTGTGDVINIIATNNRINNVDTNPGKISPRHGILENLIIAHYHISVNESIPGHSIKISGGSYIRLERLAISGGQGIKLDNTFSYQEFIWMRQIALNTMNDVYPNPPSSIEINQGNNIYLNEIDVNDVQTGILLKTTSANSIHDIVMERLAVVRCNKALVFNAHAAYIGRIKLLDSTIYIKDTNGSMALEFLRSGGFNISDSVFDTIFIDKLGGSGHYTINDPNAGVVNCRFLNFRVPSDNSVLKCTLKVGNQNNELNFVNVKKSDTVTTSIISGLVYTINLAPFGMYTINSPFPDGANPVAIVSTNQKIPFKVTTTNTNGGTSQLHVEFASAPSGTVYISYHLTGFYYQQ